MATHYIPRNVKGEGRILYIFTTKALITTAIGGGIGFLLYFIFSIVGIILLIIFALLGFAVGTVKIPAVTGIKFTKNVAGDSIDDIIMRYAKFKVNKKIYVYTKEEE